MGRVFSYLDLTLGLGPGSSIKQKFFSQDPGPPHQASRAPFRPTRFGPKSWPNMWPKSWPNLKKKKKNIFIFRSHQKKIKAMRSVFVFLSNHSSCPKKLCQKLLSSVLCFHVLLFYIHIYMFLSKPAHSKEVFPEKI